ncbi:MAG: N(G),N(G)-dimethylarginine dimethylaminohydrolase [Mycoplasma sp.]|nr:N(G),N(G)-dimethylarginine dimethylaminohydrolase [Mycoplasma sp.]
MKKLNYVITKTPSTSIIYGISRSQTLGNPIYSEAVNNHSKYIQILKSIGLMVHQMPPNEMFPKSCFVEDVAILTKKCAVITNPGEASRNGEKTEMAANVSRYYPLDKIHYIQYPGTLDGSDVVMVNDLFFVGISERTNNDGINQLTNIFRGYGFTVIPIFVSNKNHLKSNLCYIENNNMLVSSEYYNNPAFDQFNKILVPQNEEKALKSVWANGTIIMPFGCPETQSTIQSLSQYNIVNLNSTEFEKLDGGISSLSIIF